MSLIKKSDLPKNPKNLPNESSVSFFFFLPFQKFFSMKQDSSAEPVSSSSEGSGSLGPSIPQPLASLLSKQQKKILQVVLAVVSAIVFIIGVVLSNLHGWNKVSSDAQDILKILRIILAQVNQSSVSVP